MNNYIYTFPSNTIINNVNISNMSVNVDELHIGGIGRGGPASKLLAEGMEMIDNSDHLYNLPYCIEVMKIFNDTVKDIVSVENKCVQATQIKEIIEKAIQEGITEFNLPINAKVHALLAHLSIDKKSNQFNLYFFDSGFCSGEICKERYDYIKEAIETLSPIWVKKYRVHHILHQGSPKSTGCGYYTLYTALLLKNTPAETLIKQFTEQCAHLYDEKDDTRIRTELVVRSMLHYGVENVVDGNNSAGEKKRLHSTHDCNFIFRNIGFDAMVDLKRNLEPRVKLRDRLFTKIDSNIDFKHHPHQTASKTPREHWEI